MATIGDFPMPEDFRYKDVYLKGKPQHSKTDPFRLRHPSMDVRKRAKIFAPFDALKGYNEAVAAKNVLYEDKRELNEEDQDELNRRLGILHNLTYNSRMAGLAEEEREVSRQRSRRALKAGSGCYGQDNTHFYKFNF